MVNSRLRSLAKPAISVAGAGLGAALAGPVGGAIGRWLGDALGASTSRVVKESTRKFGEKIIEKIADVSTDLLGEKLKTPSLEGLYREALGQSLRKIQAEPGLQPFGDWFSNWERSLSGIEPLNLAMISGGQLAPEKLNTLFHDTMVTLDAQGRALRENQLPLRLATRTIPEALDSALNTLLPPILRRTFRSLITKAEYEAAWKEANQLFQDEVQLMLNSLGEVTQRIDLRTKEIVNSTRAIRHRVEREPDAPLLMLELAEPAVLPWSIPPARDQNADVLQGLTTEGRRLGAPDPHWLSEALANRRERLKSARKILENEVDPARWGLEWWIRSQDAGHPVDEMEKYAAKVEEWYRIAAYNLHLQHHAQTARVRSVLLVFRISNAGRIPAEKATVELRFSKNLSVKEYVSESVSLDSPPEIPSALEDRVAAPIPQKDLDPIDWYPGWQRPKTSFNDLFGPEFFRRERDDSDFQHFHPFIQRLEHGDFRRTRPLPVNFRDQPTRPLRIGYTLHATNQPLDSSDEIAIEIREKARSTS